MLNDNRDVYRPLLRSISIEQQRVHLGTSFGRKNNDVVGHDDTTATISDEESGFCMRVPRAEVFGLLGGALTSDDIVRKDSPYPTTTHAGRCYITCAVSPSVHSFLRERRLQLHSYVLCVLRVETARAPYRGWRGKKLSCLFPCSDFFLVSSFFLIVSSLDSFLPFSDQEQL